MPCPEPGALSAYQAGLLTEPARDVLERHALACLPCRESLRLMGSPEAETVPQDFLRRLQGLRPFERILPLRRIAAAILLAGAFAGWMALSPPGRDARQGIPMPSLPKVSEALPTGRLGDPDAPRAFLARGADLVLAPGTRVLSLSEGEGRRLRVESGRLWLEVSSGEPVVLDLPGGSMTLARGTVALNLKEAPAAAWLLREAAAAEMEATVWVLEGEAHVAVGNKRLTLQAPRRFRAGADPSAIPPEELEALFQARAEAAAAVPGRDVLTPGFRLGDANPTVSGGSEAPPAWRWVTVLEGRSPTTELKFSLPADGAWLEWPAGLAGREASAREILELAWDGDTLRGRLNGRHFLSLGRTQLRRVLLPAGKPAWGISVWGGTATVLRSTLQEGIR